MAALLTRPSIGPRVDSTVRTKACPASASLMSTEPWYSWSGYFSPRAVSSGVTVRAKAATFRPAASRSVTIASPRPREPPDTRTTDAGGTTVGSDIALQRLFLRDLVEEPDPPRYAVVRQPVGAPLDQVGVGDRAEFRVRHHLGGDHPADQRRFACEHPRPGDARMPHQHVADDAGGHLRAADVDLVGVEATSDQHAVALVLDPVAGADRTDQPVTLMRRADDQLLAVDRQHRAVRARLALQPLARESGLAIVHDDRGTDLGGGVNPGDPGLREDLPQLVEDRLVDRLTAESDLLQRYGTQRVGVAVERLPPEGRCAGGRSEEHTSELQSRPHLVCRLLLEKKKLPNKEVPARTHNNQELR